MGIAWMGLGQQIRGMISRLTWFEYNSMNIICHSGPVQTWPKARPGNGVFPWSGLDLSVSWYKLWAWWELLHPYKLMTPAHAMLYLTVAVYPWRCWISIRDSLGKTVLANLLLIFRTPFLQASYEWKLEWKSHVFFSSTRACFIPLLWELAIEVWHLVPSSSLRKELFSQMLSSCSHQGFGSMFPAYAPHEIQRGHPPNL